MFWPDFNRIRIGSGQVNNSIFIRNDFCLTWTTRNSIGLTRIRFCPPPGAATSRVIFELVFWNVRRKWLCYGVCVILPVWTVLLKLENVIMSYYIAMRYFRSRGQNPFGLKNVTWTQGIFTLWLQHGKEKYDWEALKYLGAECTTREEINEIISGYFTNIFSSEGGSCVEVLQCVEPRIKAEQNHSLIEPFSPADVRNFSACI